MHYITIVYVISKLVSTALTFVVVRTEADLLWIPALDIISNLIAVMISLAIIRRLKIPVRLTSFKDCLMMLKDSFIYFFSGAATTAFSALTTLLIGIYLKDLEQIAYWGVCLNIIIAIQGLYAPVCNSIYPHMIRVKSLKFIHKTLMIFMPIVTAGCIFSFFVSESAILIIAGERYIPAVPLFRCMIPILFFSFPAQLYGWPTLGALGKTKQTTLTTVIAAVVQMAGLVVLGVLNCFTVYALALWRSLTEALLMGLRMGFVYKDKSFSRQGGA